MAYSDVPPNTGASYSTQSPDSVRILWQKKVDYFAQSENFFKQFEGTSSESCILTTQDTSKGNGQKLRITTGEGFYGEGKSGDSQFETTADFETQQIGDYELQIDVLRNAVSINKRAEEYMGMRGELTGGFAQNLGSWMGREMTYRMMMLFRERGGSGNLMYSGSGASDQNSLTSANLLTWSDIVTAKAQLMPMGGRPAFLKYDGNKNPVNRYIVVGTEKAITGGLKLDSEYREIVRTANDRSGNNPLFTGNIVDVDGNIIKEMNVVDHAGNGAIGSPFAPRAFLGVAVTAGTTAIDIKGGGNATFAADTSKLFFKFFDNFAYEFIPADIITPGTDTRYFLIVNPKGSGAGQDGKVGMYSYTTGNNGNKITIVGRLGSAASGARVTTLGDVTWNTGVWAAGALGFAGHTDAHPVGSWIIQCNSKGQAYGDTIVMGAQAALRGYGMYNNKRETEMRDVNFVTRVAIATDFGQTLRKDRSGRAPGYIRIRHSINYPGLGLPTVT